MNTFKLLQTLTETPAPSGNEQAVAHVIQKIWEPFTNSQKVDRVGSVIAIKEGQGTAPRRRILLAAHLDEIGLLVSQVVEHNGYGFLRVTAVGGVDRRQVYGQQAIVHGQQDLLAVIGALPSHMQNEERKGKPYNYEEIAVDVGLPIAKVRELVSIGDFVSFRQPLRKLQGKRVAGKSLDNRASMAAVTICLEILQNRRHSWDVIAVATAQEETRLLGAATSAFAQRPDAAIAIDVTWASGGGVTGHEVFDMGSGPVLDIGPNVHTGMFEALQETANDIEMSVNINTHNRASGTDAYALQVARVGMPTAVISIPLRNMHTRVENLDMVDVERVGRLLAEFIARLDDKFLDDLAADMMKEDK
jgi:endoglucanase